MQTNPIEIEFTKHGTIRSRQGGFKAGYIESIVLLGTDIGDDQIFCSNKDADREILRLREQIKIIDRIRNRTVVIRKNRIVTCYLSNQTRKQRIRQRERKKG